MLPPTGNQEHFVFYDELFAYHHHHHHQCVCVECKPVVFNLVNQFKPVTLCHSVPSSDLSLTALWICKNEVITSEFQLSFFLFLEHKHHKHAHGHHGDHNHSDHDHSEHMGGENSRNITTGTFNVSRLHHLILLSVGGKLISEILLLIIFLLIWNVNTVFVSHFLKCSHKVWIWT